jgi:hypothetical protein
LKDNHSAKSFTAPADDARKERDRKTRFAGEGAAGGAGEQAPSNPRLTISFGAIPGEEYVFFFCGCDEELFVKNLPLCALQ